MLATSPKPLWLLLAAGNTMWRKTDCPALAASEPNWLPVVSRAAAGRTVPHWNLTPSVINYIWFKWVTPLFKKQGASWFYLSICFTDIKTMENASGFCLKHGEGGLQTKVNRRVCSQGAGERRARADTRWAVTEQRVWHRRKPRFTRMARRGANIWRQVEGGGTVRDGHRYVVFWSL